jgi:hypothetical protein
MPTVEELVDGYKSGSSIRQLAVEAGRSYTWTRDKLVDAEVELRPPSSWARASQQWSIETHARGLSALMGENRARALLCLDQPASSALLGKRLGLNRHTAKQHAAVLRGAGLVTSAVPAGQLAEVHSLTELGRALMEGRVDLAPPH